MIFRRDPQATLKVDVPINANGEFIQQGDTAVDNKTLSFKFAASRYITENDGADFGTFNTFFEDLIDTVLDSTHDALSINATTKFTAEDDE